MLRFSHSPCASLASGAFAAVSLLGIASALAADPFATSWRYYRPGNTGIQGDYCDAIHIAADGNPWIGGYDPGFEEGGVAKFIQSENRWINYSNVDYPVIGHPEITGTTRVADIAEDASGRLWCATWRGCFRFDPTIGPSSLVNLASQNAALSNGGCRDIEFAPDGTVWFALLGYGGNMGGVLRHNPATGAWKYWTGGTPPVGGGNWPNLVWAVRSLSILDKPGGGYLVYADSDTAPGVVVFDSTNQLWNFQEFGYTPGAIYDLAGKEASDAAGNLWAIRFVNFVGSAATYSLDYRKPDGSWVTPPAFAAQSGVPDVSAFRAFGDRQALLVDGSGRVYRFNGSTWSNLGVWLNSYYTSDVNIDAAGNVWASGVGGAAKRNVSTGVWQRYRVTNTGNFDSFNADLAIDHATGHVYACANAGPGVGGMTKFDGVRWTGFNNAQYGLGVSWPFPTDNSQAVGFRPSLQAIAVNPTYNGIRQWNGSAWSNLNGSSESRGLVEDSLGRLWSLGLYFELEYLSGSTWVSVPNNGAWGNNIQKDPDRPGTIWAATTAEVIRTDGVYRYAKNYNQFPELNPQSDVFHTVAAGPDGTAWLGTTQGLFKLDAKTNTYQFFTSVGGISCVGASPLAVTKDGRVWFSMFDIYGPGPHGLVWFDGVNAGIYSAPKQGEPQWGGLPHAQIDSLEMHEIEGGYELWMSCMSRGLAVLTVPYTWTDLGFAKSSAFGTPKLAGIGSLTANANAAIDLTAAKPNSLATLIVGTSTLNLPFLGGTLVPSPTVVLTLPTNASGSLHLPFTFPSGIPGGTAFTLQYWIADSSATFGYSASNALEAVVP